MPSAALDILRRITRLLNEAPKTDEASGYRSFHLKNISATEAEKKMVDRLREHLKANLVDFDYWAPED